ncbi:MAG: hypothetical protein ACR2NU_06275 [Aeoliella sp.]
MATRPFNADEPIAYFITWTYYGTWLSGDERGWQRWKEGGAQPPSDLLVEMAASAMKETTFTLSASDREVVEQTVVRHCEIRSWTLLAVNARSNHVPGVACGGNSNHLSHSCF